MGADIHWRSRLCERLDHGGLEATRVLAVVSGHRSRTVRSQLTQRHLVLRNAAALVAAFSRNEGNVCVERHFSTSLFQSTQNVLKWVRLTKIFTTVRPRLDPERSPREQRLQRAGLWIAFLPARREERCRAAKPNPPRVIFCIASRI